MLSTSFALRNAVTVGILKQGASLSSRVAGAKHSRSLSTTERSEKSLQEEAEAFNNMLRKWNPQAYQKVDHQIQRELEREEITAFAKKLRQWNPSAYSVVDAEHREAAARASGAAAADFNPKKVRGVFWTDAHGRDHVHKIQKPKPSEGAPA